MTWSSNEVHEPFELFDLFKWIHGILFYLGYKIENLRVSSGHQNKWLSFMFGKLHIKFSEQNT